MQLGRFNGTPEEVLQNAELKDLFLPLLGADFAIIETYVYAAEMPLDCLISAFGGPQDHKVSRADLTAWRDQTRATCSLPMFAGGHFFLHRARTLLLRSSVDDLTQFLSQTNGNHPL